MGSGQRAHLEALLRKSERKEQWLEDRIAEMQEQLERVRAESARIREEAKQ